MPRLVYEQKKFASDTLDAIHTANRILEDYAQQGYDLTLRQLFYQHVARGLLPNTERSYKRLGSIVNDARMAGYIDWDYITDRTRAMRALQHWRDPAHIIGSTARRFLVDMWERQDHYVEVWIEKDALVGVIQGVCHRWDVPYFSCRGYTSQSEMWAASQRLFDAVVAGKTVTILHLGDHDPSGIDMTRDIRERLSNFIGMDYVRHQIAESSLPVAQWSGASMQVEYRKALDNFEVKRIALTMDQIDQYNPPPNPAKLSDSRAEGYIARYGDQSWELDALDPPTMTALIDDEIDQLVDPDVWDEDKERQREGQRLLSGCSELWTEVSDWLGDQMNPTPDDEEDDDEPSDHRST